MYFYFIETKFMTIFLYIKTQLFFSGNKKKLYCTGTQNYSTSRLSLDRPFALIHILDRVLC